MKLHSLFIFLFIVFEIQFAGAQEAELFQLVKQKKYTELQKHLESGNTKEETRAVYQSILLNVFGRAEASNKIIEEVLEHNNTFPDSVMFMLLETQHDNYVKLFDYKNAYKTKQVLLDKYSSFYEKNSIEDEEQTLNLLKVLRDISPQTVSEHEDVEVPLTRNFMGLQKIPVVRNGATYSFIFDTGAGISTVTDSIAEVLKLRIIDNIPVVVKGGITGLGTNIRLGIADKLTIGTIEVSNVVFLVFPDSTLTFNIIEGRVKLDAIIGFPVIKELGSVTLYEDKLRINRVSDEENFKPNMAIDFLKPILFLNYKGEDLPFTFDTGADNTVLTEVFYNRFKPVVEKEGFSKTRSFGGAGGIKNFKVFVLPVIHFTSLGDTIVLKEVSVSTERIATGNDVYYGNIGQDLVKQYKSMTINFRRSWIKFNK